jgi:hypothetical protein
MAEDTFRIVVTVAVFLAALSMVGQAVFAYSTWKAVQALRQRAEGLMNKADPIIDTAGKIVHDAKPRIDYLTTQAVEVADLARVQVERYDELLKETADRARIQIERLDNVLSDTAVRVHETTSAVQSTILRPVREVNGVVSGVRAAISVLAKGNRASVERATQDEEMFI